MSTSSEPTLGDESSREPEQDYRPKDEEEANDDYLAPSHWWFTTTLFPLVAATFGPLATTFNICALTTDFREVVNPNSTVGASEDEGVLIGDPAWSVALNAVSLVLAIIGNLALLGHTMNKLNVRVAQPIIVVAWYFSSFILIALIAALPPDAPLTSGQPRTFTQAYYYACLAAALYFILASIMVVTSWHIYGLGISKGYKLTMAQRTLMIQVCMFLGYILCAAAVYMKIEGWAYLDAVYWVDVTLFTIGFGDFSPKTHLGRGLLFPMALGGILFVGLIVASISTVALERGSHKISRRNFEKARRAALDEQGSDSGKTRQRDSAHSTKDNERDFNLMRKAQSSASRKDAIIAISVSSLAWLLLWLIGGVVFWQAELSTQGWSYFEGLYFTYVAFTTIGYGDFYPQDPSAKPAFVLWSMLALPTLTVLIGAIGNSINEGVNTAVLLMAEKLPRKTPGLSQLKGAAESEKKDNDGAFKQAKPPGFMSDGEDMEQQNGQGSVAQAAQGIAGAQSNGKQDKAEHYRGFLLMKEIQNVVNHLDATPPRKYTYAEWVWFLKLLGEDERDWSWTSHKSPLITESDEPRWVLRHLMKKLEQDLESSGHDREE